MKSCFKYYFSEFQKLERLRQLFVKVFGVGFFSPHVQEIIQLSACKSYDPSLSWENSLKISSQD